jgi:hypothetical protein
MKNGDFEERQDIQRSKDRNDRFKRRLEVLDGFGIFMLVPDHGQDIHGNWQYGIQPSIELESDAEIVADFADQMRSIISESARSLVIQGTLTLEEVEQIEIEQSVVGAGAYSWPQLVIDLFHDAQPFLSNGADLLAWGYFLKEVVSRIKFWADSKDAELRRNSDEKRGFSNFKPSPSLTRSGLMALCYVDLVERYGIGGNVTIDVFPRSRLHFVSIGHPAQGVSYLIRFKSGDRSFFYQLNEAGAVTEHYLLSDNDLTLLPLPELLPIESQQLLYKFPQPSERVAVRAGSSRDS